MFKGATLSTVSALALVTFAAPQVFGYYDGTQSESRNLQLNLRLVW